MVRNPGVPCCGNEGCENEGWGNEDPWHIATKEPQEPKMMVRVGRNRRRRYRSEVVNKNDMMVDVDSVKTLIKNLIKIDDCVI